MSDQFDQPMFRIPLGLKPSLKPTYGTLIRRSRNQLRLLHSGQAQLDQLTDEQYLRAARLVVEDDHYILVAPIPDPPQLDLVGYPSGAPLPSVGRGDAANEAEQPGRRDAEDDASKLLGEHLTNAPSSSADMLDLGAALDALLSDVDLPGSIVGVAERETSARRSGGAIQVQGAVGAPERTPAGLPRPLSEARQSQLVERFAPVEAKRLKVDQALNCVERSAGMLNQVVDILTTSSDVVGDIRDLERRTGLKSGPSRLFIASRQPELVAEVDGRQVPFLAPPVRTEVAGANVVQVQVRFLQTRSENDVLRVDVLEAIGAGVPRGVVALGAHDVRYIRLNDFQRGVLLILRGAAQKLSLGVREGISTTRLVRGPALVVDPGDWSELKRLAMDALSESVLHGNVGPGDVRGEDDSSGDADTPDDPPLESDGQEAA